MGISVELWRARIGLFSGGRGSRPHSKAPSTKHQPLHFSDTVGTTVKVVQGGLLLLYILTFLSSQDKTEFLKRERWSSCGINCCVAPLSFPPLAVSWRH